jgi:hypothetical protein
LNGFRHRHRGIGVLTLVSGSQLLVEHKFCYGPVVQFLRLFPLTLLQDLSFIFQQVRGLSGYTSSRGECSVSLLTYPPYRLRSLRDCLAAELGATTWQSHGYASVDILVHNRAGDLARSRAGVVLQQSWGLPCGRAMGYFSGPLRSIFLSMAELGIRSTSELGTGPTAELGTVVIEPWLISQLS